MGSREHNFYNAAFQRAGYEDVAKEAQSLWLEGNREGATALIPDEMVLKTNLLGTEEMVKDRIRAYRDAGVTTISADPDGRDFGERVATLGRFMRLLGEVNEE
jgi:alkanesulfonate monooxygenase SsuD/methylene tetrahydromethanopterin reductase-like flavin-dependent oxidoreductase (luciferase family)